VITRALLRFRQYKFVARCPTCYAQGPSGTPIRTWTWAIDVTEGDAASTRNHWGGRRFCERCYPLARALLVMIRLNVGIVYTVEVKRGRQPLWMDFEELA
jgi:hypothetical protein